MPYILVLYYSRYGSVAALADAFAEGIELVDGVEARLRTVPSISPDTDASEPVVPTSGALYCSEEDWSQAAGLALGSPGRFGNMAAPLKYFLEQTSTSWVSSGMVGKPATLFTSTTTAHGGQESTLLSMMLPLMHHGMLIQPVPFFEPALHQNGVGGSPYGVSHVAGEAHQPLPETIYQLARKQGQRLAFAALSLLETPKT